MPRSIDAGRYSRKRAIVLLLVHVLFIVHIVHWRLSGRTLAPLELNEVVYTLELGIVTAGFIFMVVAFASSLVFGRFFCSWGCHILALQDGSAWILRKLGFKPRPVRSRLLALGPYVVVAYMFVWPQVERIAEGRAFPGFRIAGDSEGWASFVTSDYWRNLPGAGVVVSTFLICGFVMVYTLGTRSFCRYACPYGAAFAIADRFAPVRIRATKPCSACGVCTAACDSQVRVHEEIGRYGMIVDSNCLRDLDCVAVCSEGALEVVRSRPSLLRRVIGDVEVRHLYDFSLAEDLVGAVVAVVTVLILRGLYDIVPFFVSIALGILTAYVVLTLGRLALRPQVSFARLGLKQGGRLRAAGFAFLVIGLGWIALLAHSGYVRWNAWVGLREYAKGEPSALEHLERVNAAGLIPSPRALSASLDLHHRAAKTAYEAGKLPLSIEHLGRIVRLEPRSAAARCELGAMLLEVGEIELAIAQLREAIRIDPSHSDSHHNLAVALMQLGALDEAMASSERAVELAPADSKARELRDHLRAQRLNADRSTR